jgi:hypothetical protein
MLGFLGAKLPVEVGAGHFVGPHTGVRERDPIECPRLLRVVRLALPMKKFVKLFQSSHKKMQIISRTLSSCVASSDDHFSLHLIDQSY